MNRKLTLQLILVVLAFAFGPCRAQAVETVVFGPVVVTPTQGQRTSHYTFDNRSAAIPPYRMAISNSSGYKPSIRLNGEQIFSSKELGRLTGVASKTISLTTNNALEVTGSGSANKSITITIFGVQPETDETVLDQRTETFGESGGSVVLDGFAQVKVLPLAGRENLLVLVEKVINPGKSNLYAGESVGGLGAMPEMLKITATDVLLPNGVVSLQISPDFLSNLPSGFVPEIFAEVQQIATDGELLTRFERLSSQYVSSTQVIYATLPPYAFAPSEIDAESNNTSSSVASGSAVVATIILGSYDGAPETEIVAENVTARLGWQQPTPSNSLTANAYDLIYLAADLTFSLPPMIGNPLHHPLVVTDPMGPRINPVTLRPQLHTGTDFRSNLEPVYAAGQGKVTKSGMQSNCKNIVDDVCQEGYGHRVEITHIDGTRTVYGHLLADGLIPNGTPVNQNTPIGVSDSTGGITGPHLHFDYYFNGRPVDPVLFIEQQDFATHFQGLSVVAVMNGVPIESSRLTIGPGPATDPSKAFAQYLSFLDLQPLQLLSGEYDLAFVVQKTDASGILLDSEPAASVALTIRGEQPVDATVTWSSSADVDLGASKIDNYSGEGFWHAFQKNGDPCGIPTACLSPDVVTGPGSESFHLSALEGHQFIYFYVWNQLKILQPGIPQSSATIHLDLKLGDRTFPTIERHLQAGESFYVLLCNGNVGASDCFDL